MVRELLIIFLLPNGSDHVVIAYYLGLYEEGEIEHINDVRPGFLGLQQVGC